MVNFGKEATLKDACRWLQDPRNGTAILDVTERNSVIEGLPPFQEETRQRILAQLQQLSRGERPQALRMISVMGLYSFRSKAAPAATMYRLAPSAV